MNAKLKKAVNFLEVYFTYDVSLREKFKFEEIILKEN